MGHPSRGIERCRILGFNLEMGTAGCLTIQIVARDDKKESAGSSIWDGIGRNSISPNAEGDVDCVGGGVYYVKSSRLLEVFSSEGGIGGGIDPICFVLARR
jgi:hypothetical protein